MDNVADFKTLRARAEECRALAQMVGNAQAREGFLHAAQMYEAAAAHSEALELSRSSRPSEPPGSSTPL